MSKLICQTFSKSEAAPVKQSDARPPLDAREQTLVARVAEAIAAYRGETPEEFHRRMAVKLLRGVLRNASKRQPVDLDTLVG